MVQLGLLVFGLRGIPVLPIIHLLQPQARLPVGKGDVDELPLCDGLEGTGLLPHNLFVQGGVVVGEQVLDAFEGNAAQRRPR